MTSNLGFNQFSQPFAQSDEGFIGPLLQATQLAPEAEARITSVARKLIETLRVKSTRLGGFDDLLHEYSLSSEEGLALMVLAEALLRVPDDLTADRLLADKLTSSHWAEHGNGSAPLVVAASAWAFGLSSRVIGKAQQPEGLIKSLAQRLGMGTVRLAARQAMRIMGTHFVLGETIEAGLREASTTTSGLSRYSFDMLGEGARTQADAEHYFNSYAHAIDRIGASAGARPLPERPGISIKLSGLHPRYEPRARARVLSELTPRVLDLALMAKANNLNFTIDAEEAGRLELSLDLIELLLADSRLRGWDGFGLAVQAYQKRAFAVIEQAQVDGAACQGCLLG
jgi:RHH-type proline utilization regulon transcriptional repressor/proline dehydrogenase/delta 1-pyrroline-5-carboxylate dehydrogenase